MDSSCVMSIIIAVFAAFIAILGFMGKSIAFKGLDKCSKEQITKFSRFSAWGYVIVAICSGVSAYFQYNNTFSDFKSDIPFFVSIVICLIIVEISKKKYLKNK